MKDVYRDLFKAARLLSSAEAHLQKALDELTACEATICREESDSVELTLEKVQAAQKLLLIPESIKLVLPNF